MATKKVCTYLKSYSVKKTNTIPREAVHSKMDFRPLRFSFPAPNTFCLYQKYCAVQIKIFNQFSETFDNYAP
jgi:hypothetical protein